MIKSQRIPQDTPEDNNTTASKGNSLSMHEGVPVWYDCCSCEAEPYWTERADDPDPKVRKD